MKQIAIYVITSLLIYTNLTARSLSKESQATAEMALNGPYELRVKALKECSALPFCMRSLLKGLQDEDVLIRELSARSLGALALPESAGPLKAALEKEQVLQVKSAILWAIGNTPYANDEKASEAAAAIEPLLKDEQVEIRRGAAIALGSTHAKSSQAALRSQLQSEQEERVKFEIIRSLLKIEIIDSQAQMAMIDLLKSPSAYIRRVSATTLDQYRIYAAREPLHRAIQLEEDPQTLEALKAAYVTCRYP